MKAPRLAAAALVALLPAAAAANYVPIDDFEAAPFSFSVFADTDVPIPGYAAHAYAPQRHIYLTASAGQASLSVSPLFDDSMYLLLEGPSPFCRVEYHWNSPRDLSFAGSVEAIEVRIAGPASAAISATVTNGTSTAAVPAQTLGVDGAPVTISFPIAGWAYPLTSVATALWINFSDPGEYEIYDIRFVTAGSSPTDFTGEFVAIQVPPVPSPPLQFTAYDDLANPLFAADVSILDALTSDLTVPGGDWSWSELPRQAGGEMSLASFQWTDFGGVLETDFDLQVDISAADGWLPELYPPDPVYGPESIALGFPVAMRNPNGTVGGVSNTWLTFDFDENQLGSLEFYDVAVTPNVPSALRSWTSGFTLHFRMALSGMNSPDETYPLFHATWIGDWTTAVPTSAVTPVPMRDDDALRLTAVPSVTRGSTEIRASRPFRRAATLFVHDVTGRRVRSLAADAGVTAVRWDGRNEAGRPAAAGVYFVRVSGVPANTARVVKAGVR